MLVYIKVSMTETMTLRPRAFDHLYGPSQIRTTGGKGTKKSRH